MPPCHREIAPTKRRPAAHLRVGRLTSSGDTTSHEKRLSNLVENEEFDKAAALLDTVCEEGCLYLAVLHARGLGGDRDQRRAASLQTKSASLAEKKCNTGDAQACVTAASAYDERIGWIIGSVDLEKAKGLYKKLASSV